MAIYLGGEEVGAVELYKPTATKSITSNGIQDVLDYAKVNVNVSVQRYVSPTIIKVYTDNILLSFGIGSNGTIYWGDGVSTSASGTVSLTFSDGNLPHVITIYPNVTTTSLISTETNKIILGTGTILTPKNMFNNSSTEKYTFPIEVELGDLVKINPGAFRNCTNSVRVNTQNWNSLILVSGLLRTNTSISARTFGGSSFKNSYTNQIEPVILGNSISEIEVLAFSNTDLIELIITRREGIITLVNTNAIPSTIQKIKVPSNLVSQYKNATNWSNFASKIIAG